jgi:hypothetical protein
VPEPWDDQFRKTGDERVEPERRGQPVALWIVVAALVVLVAIAAYVVFGGRFGKGETQPVSAPAPVAATPPAQPLGGDVAPIALPPLDESDALVRELVGKLSSHPRVTAWLATKDLIRNFTLVVANIVEGRTLAPVLPALRPPSGFRTIERRGNLFIDPKSYMRYAGIAEAVSSIDPAGSAKLYSLLKPRIEEAYVELGHRNMPFDSALERAIVLLLDVQVQDAPLRIEPRGIGYGFADSRLEALAGAQKQLLRMGPENARAIQQKLREIGLALGIPAARLPPSRS